MGWREFVDELVIVIVGVLIALWVGKLSSSIDWQSRDSKTRAALSAELADALTNLDTRRAIAPCMMHRLDAIAAVLRDAQTSGRLPEVPDLPLSPGANWENGTWQVSVDSETASNLPVEQLNRLSLVYSNIARLQGRNDREREAWARLATISGPARAVSADELGQLRTSANLARDMEARMEIASSWMPQMIRRTGLEVRLSEQQRKQIAQSAQSFCAGWPNAR
jgi:hypothetical protein